MSIFTNKNSDYNIQESFSSPETLQESILQLSWHFSYVEACHGTYDTVQGYSSVPEYGRKGYASRLTHNPTKGPWWSSCTNPFTLAEYNVT